MRTIAWIQGVYFALTGIWPLIDIKSFLAVTGPKTDLWLVKTVGLMILAVGLALCIAGWVGSPRGDIVVLAMGSALALCWVDIFYSLSGVISKIYLCDAIAEIILIFAWGIAILKSW